MPQLPVVFLGLSLSVKQAREIFDADYRPPLRAGDLDDIRSDVAIGIVDGILDCGARLPVKEAHRALRRELRLFGAASTGALLAAELESAGMIGLGRVFSFLRSYAGDREDLIRALYHEHGNAPLTVALIEAVLAVESVRPERTETAIKDLAALPLPRRTRCAVESCIEPFLGQRSGSDTPIESRFGAKADDTRLLLRHLSKLTSRRRSAEISSAAPSCRQPAPKCSDAGPPRQMPCINQGSR